MLSVVKKSRNCDDICYSAMPIRYDDFLIVTMTQLGKA